MVFDCIEKNSMIGFSGMFVLWKSFHVLETPTNQILIRI